MNELGIFMDMRHVIELLKRADCHDEAAAVGLVMQQRAELLEALKRIKVAAAESTCSDIEWIAHEAMTKADAAE